MNCFIKSFDYVMKELENQVKPGRLKVLYRDPIWFESNRIVHSFVKKHIDKALESERNHKLGWSENVEPHRYTLLNEMAKLTQDKVDLRS